MGSKPPKFRCTDSSKTCVRAIAAGASLLGFRAAQQNATFTPIRDHLGNVGLEKQGTLMPMRNTLAATFFFGLGSIRRHGAGARSDHRRSVCARFSAVGPAIGIRAWRERGYYTAQKVNLAAFDPGRGGADSITKVASAIAPSNGQARPDAPERRPCMLAPRKGNRISAREMR
jgi:hypothetical protein